MDVLALVISALSLLIAGVGTYQANKRANEALAESRKAAEDARWFAVQEAVQRLIGFDPTAEPVGGAAGQPAHRIDRARRPARRLGRHRLVAGGRAHSGRDHWPAGDGGSQARRHRWAAGGEPRPADELGARAEQQRAPSPVSRPRRGSPCQAPGQRGRAGA